MSDTLRIRENARKLANYRWVEIQMMELMGGWAQSVPEADVKVTFGYHIYGDALHADKIKKRLPELMARSPKRHERAPSDAFVRLCEKIWLAEDTTLRLIGLYRILKGSLIQAYEQHLQQVDSPPDQPTEWILREILNEEQRQVDWAEARIESLLNSDDKRRTAEAWERELRSDLAASGGIVSGPQAPEATATFEKRFAYSKAPVRDERWTIVEDAAEYEEKNYSFADPEGKLHLLHDLLNSEYITVERIGRILAEFPDLPWEMKVDLARQAWDEARHAEIMQKRLEELGGRVGMYPINFWGWEFDVNHPDPLARLALSNATFESESCKHVKTWIERAKESGDLRSVQVLEYILADEVTHVHFGNKWIDRLTENDPQRRQAVRHYARHILETGERPRGIYFEETPEAGKR